MVNVVPLPGSPSLCASMVPPCARISCLVIASPSPLWVLSLRDLSARQKMYPTIVEELWRSMSEIVEVVIRSSLEN